MSLLLTVVTAAATSLGRLNEEAEKTFRVAMMSLTLNAAALKERKLDASNPAPTKPQGETAPP